MSGRLISKFLCKSETWETETGIICKKTGKECCGFYAKDYANRVLIETHCPLFKDYPQYKIKQFLKGNPNVKDNDDIEHKNEMEDLLKQHFGRK